MTDSAFRAEFHFPGAVSLWNSLVPKVSEVRILRFLHQPFHFLPFFQYFLNAFIVFKLKINGCLFLHCALLGAADLALRWETLSEW